MTRVLTIILSLWVGASQATGTLKLEGSLITQGHDGRDPRDNKPPNYHNFSLTRWLIWRCSKCNQAFNGKEDLRAHSRANRHDTVYVAE